MKELNLKEKRMTQYLTAKQFPEKHPAFTHGGIRSLIFHGDSNGLNASGAIIRIGRKILIDEEKFFGWVISLNESTGAARAIAITKTKPLGEKNEQNI